MMDSYFEIKAIPDPELLQSAVVAQLIQVLHQILPEFCGRIGLSFPAYGQARTLGGILRIHATKQDVENLHSRLRNHPTLNSYALITHVSVVPDSIRGHVRFQRRHVKSASDMRRLIKRHKERGTWTEALERAITEKYRNPKSFPHVILKSSSTRQPRFPLLVEKKNIGAAVEGSFDAYGLSKTATIPWF